MSNTLTLLAAGAAALSMAMAAGPGRFCRRDQERRPRQGAWADGSGWKGVYDILTSRGYNVSIVQIR